jgi:hypothetical protein
MKSKEYIYIYIYIKRLKEVPSKLSKVTKLCDSDHVNKTTQWKANHETLWSSILKLLNAGEWNKNNIKF